MSTFKLLALRPEKGSAKEIVKNLVQEQFYFFDQGYQPTAELDFIQKVGHTSGIPDNNFYYKKQHDTSSSLEFVNIQAIVGKNGEGKSSLIDFAIRILNNFHYLILPANHNQLLYIKDVYGELYFEIDNQIFRIKFQQNDDSCTLEVFLKGIITPISINESPGFPWRYEDFLFFTLGINYSLYSWNALHYRKENTTRNSILPVEDFPLKPANSWLNRLFQTHPC